MNKKSGKVFWNMIFGVWYYFVLFLIIIIHICVFTTFKEFYNTIIPIFSKVFQIIGSCITVLVISVNTNKLNFDNLWIKIADLFESLGIKSKQFSPHLNMKIKSPKISFNPTLVTRYTDIDQLAKDLQAKLDSLEERISGFEVKFNEELGVNKSDNTTFLQRVTEFVSKKLLGNFKLEFFGLLLLIYGIIFS